MGEKGVWERRKIREAKQTNGKSLWNVIEEILGKTKKDRKIYLYRDEGSKYTAEEDWTEFITSWKKNVYHKTNLGITEKWKVSCAASSTILISPSLNTQQIKILKHTLQTRR